MTLGVEVMAVGPWSQPAPWWGLMWVDGHSGMHCHLTDLRTSLFVVSSCGHPASTPCPPTLSPWHTPALQALLAFQPHPQTKWLYLVSLGRQSLSGDLHRGRHWGR